MMVALNPNALVIARFNHIKLQAFSLFAYKDGIKSYMAFIDAYKDAYDTA